MLCDCRVRRGQGRVGGGGRVHAASVPCPQDEGQGASAVHGGKWGGGAVVSRATTRERCWGRVLCPRDEGQGEASAHAGGVHVEAWWASTRSGG